MLTSQQQQILLRLARTAIAARWRADIFPEPELAIAEHCGGVFVSLHRENKLRGCIGSLEVIKPLPELVQDLARAAAFHDPRFGPLEAEELPQVEIEISLLYDFARISSTDEIELGRHGLLIRSAKRQGLLLPQVAVKRDWNV